MVSIGVMVVHAPDDIASIPANVDVFCLGRKYQRVHRQVGFKEPAVGLAFDLGEFHLFRRNAHVEPWRHFRYGKALLAIEDQLAKDLLNPRRPRLGIGRDDDVVVTKLEVVPDRRVEMVIVKFAGFLRHRQGHDPFSPSN